MVDNIIDPSYLRTVIPALADAKLDVRLFYEVKANLSREQIRTLADAGINEIQPGIESLDDAVLAGMDKGVRALQNIQTLKWCVEYSVWPWWNVIWGFPGEPADAYRRMAERIPLLTHLPPPDAGGPLRLDRFSPCFEQAAARGFVDVAPVPAYAAVYPLPSDAIANLAYFFEGRHADGRDVDAYTLPLRQAIDRWRREHPESGLHHLDRGRDLVVIDGRSIATRSVTVLSGWDRRVHLACDSQQTVASLARLLGPDGVGAVEESLARLGELGFVLRDGERYLALTVGRPDPV